MQQDTILVTGAGGFLGGEISQSLIAAGFRVIEHHHKRPEGKSVHLLGDINLITSEDLRRYIVATGVHAAGLASSSRLERITDSLQRVNVEGTHSIARAALDAGVVKFVFLSSAKVYGEFSAPGKPFSVSSPVRPQSDYAASKYSAELALRDIGKGHMVTMILRLPLVFSPRSKGGIGMLRRALKVRLPIPLAATINKRSVIYLDDVVQLIRECCDLNLVESVIILPMSKTLSTSELVSELAKEHGYNPIVLKMPRSIVSALMFLAPNSGFLSSMYGNFEISGYQRSTNNLDSIFSGKLSRFID